MSEWWRDPDAPWRAQLASLLFPGADAGPDEECDWPHLRTIVDAHRLGPWLHARGCDAPDELRERWQQAANEATIHHLQMQQDLRDLLDLLNGSGIDPIALKGTPLSLFYYDQPWQRPMRDVDLLIDNRDALLVAWGVMLEGGYTPYHGTVGEPEAILDERHQLPPLISPNGHTLVELHQRTGHAPECEAPIEIEERNLLGRALRVPAPEALLVHLVRHAARDHRFDNGPQVLVDIAMLARGAKIDMGEVDRLAREDRLERHLALLLAMASDAFPASDVAKSGTTVDDRAKRLAWTLMTSDPVVLGEAVDRNLIKTAGSSHWLARLFPSSQRLQASQGQGFLPHQYLVHYRRLATERLPRMLGRNATEDDLRSLVDWLGD